MNLHKLTCIFTLTFNIITVFIACIPQILARFVFFFFEFTYVVLKELSNDNKTID